VSARNQGAVTDLNQTLGKDKSSQFEMKINEILVTFSLDLSHKTTMKSIGELVISIEDREKKRRIVHVYKFVSVSLCLLFSFLFLSLFPSIYRFESIEYLQRASNLSTGSSLSFAFISFLFSFTSLAATADRRRQLTDMLNHRLVGLMPSVAARL
jgi:hypothetical protein